MEIAKLKQWWRWLLKWQYLWLFLLVLITLILHFSIIMHPTELVFDEKHYVEDARSIIAGQDTLRPEHPPLGKLFIASGILLFGDNPFGWRFFSIILGTIGIVLFYFICRRLAIPEKASLMAASLLALENLSFVQASVAMLDVYTVTFMLASFLLYLNGRYVLSGISVGLSTLAKLTGILALPVIFLHWFFTGRARPERFYPLLLSGLISFPVLLPLFDFIVSRQLLNPVSQITRLVGATGSITFANATHPAASRPWEWILRPEIMAYWYEPHYTATISFTIWALIIPSVLYMAFRAKREGNSAAIFGLSWFACIYLFWIPVSLITDRISYLYYFYPTVGAICTGIGLGLSQLLDIRKSEKPGKLKRTVIPGVSVYMLLHIAVFVIISPVFSQWVTLLNIVPST